MARSVFFSFDYDDIMAVNVVRNSNVVRAEDQRLPFRDRSLYEAAKNTPGAIKRAIDTALDGTSVTVVLAGSATWRSDWVRYEIAKSLERGNGFITIDLASVGPAPTPTTGPNPLSAMWLTPWQDRTGFNISQWNGKDYDSYAPVPWVSNKTAGYPGTILSPAGMGYRMDSKFTEYGSWRTVQMYFKSTIDRAAEFAGRPRVVTWI